MNMIDDIELQITNLLQSINLEIVPGYTYTYKTYTGTVNIYDETLSIAENKDDVDLPDQEFVVNYEIEPYDDEVETDFTEGAFALTNENLYRIRCKVHNRGDEESPKNAARKKMNNVLSDLKFLFGNNFALNKKCNWFLYARSKKNYTVDNDLINTGYIDVFYKLNYSQSVLNPDEYACL